jgi:tryptophan-rich sensory protein
MNTRTLHTVIQVAALMLSILLVTAAASFGALFSPGEWYAGLVKPAFNPPNWVFGPVWTLLYAMMAVSAWLVWRGRAAAPVGLALAVYGVQLVLNALWSWLFFGVHALGVAFVEIVLLWLAIAATAVLFWRVNRLAGALFIPYLAWVGFAAILNFSLWRLNTG